MTQDAEVCNALEQRLDALFVPSCDPYGAGAAALFDKPLDMISQDERDVIKRVFIRVSAYREGYIRGEREQTLRNAADMFHEVGAALAAEDLLVDVRNEKIADKLRESVRSLDQIKKIATDGFELCVRALAGMGAADVTILECGEQALGETPWSGGDDA